MDGGSLWNWKGFDMRSLLIGCSRITVISFTNSLQQQTNFQFIPYVTSTFSHHSLTAMTGLVASVVGGVSKLPLATFINVCGRPHGFAMCLLFVVLGIFTSIPIVLYYIKTH